MRGSLTMRMDKTIILIVFVSSTVALKQPNLFATLQQCHTPSDILSHVGRYVNEEGLRNLVLIRLQKQLIHRQNQGRAFDLDDKAFDVLHSLVDGLSNDEEIETTVESTKAIAVISRILELSSTCDSLTRVWSTGTSADKLEEHHLSGLVWAFDTIRTVHQDFLTPGYISDAYKKANVPFRIFPGFNSDLKDRLSVSALADEVDFRRDDIKTATDNVVKERRMTTWQGDDGVAPFAYSGKSMPRDDWSPLVRATRESLNERLDQYFDGCLLNLYPDGGSGMRYHIDPDQGTLWDYDTVVVSVGATRRFCFRSIEDSAAQPHNFVVMDGDVTHMFGDCQTRYQHTVKKAEQRGETAPRASMVFKRTFNLSH